MIGRALPTAYAFVALILTVLGGLISTPSVRADYGTGHDAPETLDCTVMDCARVLPGATRFVREDDRQFAIGYADGSDEPVGWVVLSTDVVDVPAYSGKPLVTLIGLDTDGIIAGARVIYHSEPILLLGIPIDELHDFVDFYVGKHATDRIVVGSGGEDAISVDVISGATVTALAQNQTLLDASRLLGMAVGVIDQTAIPEGHFIEEETLLTWSQMMEAGVFGRLTVTNAQMDEEDPGPFVDLWYSIIDAPQIGRSILGDHEYEYRMERLEDGQHLFVIFGNGSNSFKGSAFVRGGIFDRVRVEQGLTQLVFRDTDYTRLSQPRSEGAPRFKEAALFTTRGAIIDPGSSYRMVFLGSRYDGRGGFSREFREFSSEHILPESVYVLENPPEPMWVQAWRNHKTDSVVLILFLLFVMGVFILRKITTADSKKLRTLHLATLLTSFLVIGVYYKTQPSVTQILTFLDSIVHEWRFDLFASEPFLFISWIFIVIVSIIWGRGVFCGWVCPYGAMTELVFEIAKKLGVKPRELPEKWHSKLRYFRYVVLVVLIVAFFYDSILAEQLAEIEPFKSTFLVPFWERGLLPISWWLFLILMSIPVHRPFCRYICPLGAGLAILGSFRFSGPHRRKFCSSCTICTVECEPRAIDKNGVIDPRECLSCMQCEANYRDDEVCPPLIGIKRLTKKSGERAAKKLDKLQEQLKDV